MNMNQFRSRVVVPAALVTRYRNAKIQLIAYQKWEKAGRPHGRDVDFWLEAEKEYDAFNTKFGESLPESAVPSWNRLTATPEV